MPRNPPKVYKNPSTPPKPKLHGLTADDFDDWYRELDQWHTELENISSRNNVEMKIQRRKNRKLQKNPKKMAQMERARTKAPRKDI